MAQNSLGDLFQITSFGESHGPAVGVVIDGFPSGVEIDMELIRQRLDERKPGSSQWVSPRKEEDGFSIISGVFEGKSTGAPITILIPNQNQKPKDYDALKDVYRPSHADYTYQKKYGIRDYRGGGRSSARVTAGWVAAGAIAESFIRTKGIEVIAFVKEIFEHQIPDGLSTEELKQSQNPFRCPHPETAEKIKAEIEKAIEEKDSLGGVVSCVIKNCPVGLGEPLFGKFQAKLSHAIFSLNAVKGLQFGGGFDMSKKKGSEVNDAWTNTGGKEQTISNFSGGLQGGISNGMPIVFDVAFKPTATIGQKQETLNKEGKSVTLEATGRHDPCVVPRAVPIVQALSYLVLMDLWLLARN